MELLKISWKVMKIFLVILLVWALVSYIDIIAHNTPNSYGYLQFAKWNLLRF